MSVNSPPSNEELVELPVTALSHATLKNHLSPKDILARWERSLAKGSSVLGNPLDAPLHLVLESNDKVVTYLATRRHVEVRQQQWTLDPPESERGGTSTHDKRLPEVGVIPYVACYATTEAPGW